MEREAVSGIMLTMLLTGMLTLAFNIQTVKASGTTVYIRADGSVDPYTAPIQRDGDVYTFTDNINDEIVVERDNIVIDGAGYTVQGIGYWMVNRRGTIGYGIDLSNRSNVTIKNIEIKNFTYGIRLYESSNNTIFGNNITKNGVGSWVEISIGHGLITYNLAISLEGSSNNSIYDNNIAHTSIGIRLLYSSNNSIFGNNVTSHSDYGIGLYGSSNNNNNIFGNNITNNGYGISLGSSLNTIISGNNITNNGSGIELHYSSNNSIYHNNFINNTQQVYSFESTNAWDDGGEGNHWSDYEGVDYTGDGVGDSFHFIDEENRDNHPLMSTWTPTWRPTPFWMQWWFWTTVVVIVLVGAVYFWKKRKPPTLTAPPPPPEGTV